MGLYSVVVRGSYEPEARYDIRFKATSLQVRSMRMNGLDVDEVRYVVPAWYSRLGLPVWVFGFVWDILHGQNLSSWGCGEKEATPVSRTGG